MCVSVELEEWGRIGTKANQLVALVIRYSLCVGGGPIQLGIRCVGNECK